MRQEKQDERKHKEKQTDIATGKRERERESDPLIFAGVRASEAGAVVRAFSLTSTCVCVCKPFLKNQPQYSGIKHIPIPVANMEREKARVPLLLSLLAVEV